MATAKLMMLSDAEKLKVLEKILMELQGMEACYPEPDVADQIVERYRAATGDNRFAQGK